MRAASGGPVETGVPMTPQEFISRFPVRLYHFTDTRNIESIRRLNGLYPLATLRGQGIEIPAPGGNQWSIDADAMKGVDRFVHLCFFDEHPMEFIARRDGHIQTTRFLSVDPRILCLGETRITLDVSNKSGIPCLAVQEALEQMDLDVMYTRMDWSQPDIQARRRQVEKYEVLFPGLIPLTALSEI